MNTELTNFQNKFSAFDFKNDQEIIAYFKDKNNKADMDWLKKLVFFFFGEKVKGCPNCLVEYFIRLMKLSLELLKNKSKHRLFYGCVLEDYKHKNKPNLTQDNLTDDLAEYYKKEYPEYQKYFIR